MANHKAPTSRRTPNPAPNWDYLECGDLSPLYRMSLPLVIAPLFSSLDPPDMLGKEKFREN